MTEDDTKAIEAIKRHSGLVEVTKVSTFQAIHPETQQKVTIRIYDYGMNAGSERFEIEAETATSKMGGQLFSRMKDAIEFLEWEKL